MLSEVVRGSAVLARGAQRDGLGYTEPDPREDLSGMDVGRKALILARLLGYPGELSPHGGGVARAQVGADPARSADFLERLEELDARVAAAGGGGRGRRHGAALRGDGHAGPRSRSVSGRCRASSPLAAIKGSDNQLVFTTARYKANPLVITGPGAGAEVTAAGVLNDILRLAGA